MEHVHIVLFSDNRGSKKYILENYNGVHVHVVPMTSLEALGVYTAALPLDVALKLSISV